MSLTERSSRLNKNILFVTSGIKGEPYTPLEQAIFNALQKVVKRVTMIHPDQNLEELLKRLHPDLVLAFCGVFRPVNQINIIKGLGCKTAVWFTDDPYYTDITRSVAPQYDYVFTQDLGCVSFYQRLGCQKVFHLSLAADHSVFRPIDVDLSYQSDICFIGSGYWNRVYLIDALASYLSEKSVIISGIWWDRLRNFMLLKDKIRLNKWMKPEETARYYNGAKIVVNLHRSHNDSYNRNSENIQAVSINNRTFEISSCGAFQLTDVRQDLSEFYTPGVEIESFTSINEFIQKVDYYLRNDNERKKIALRGFQRTMKENTYEIRIKQLIRKVFS
ncbi:DUF3880 domain-containing protein [Paenactinomyces guangxiensis]|uniref:Glycosyltransferase n=1 Tax=Paenactinomyces guangxiensis TaxID=1490290 RepID=A0A7W1WQR2_9BACL|nr:DUF3880 domain-containing protein [Paenactinomyces guangxiensis]MBA4494333.1 glycosyltransferase [Paenactinomyces guangxiensis]MBH8590828.1 glycosyltransferase [Paenactinomyces guangxiensis]